MLYLGMAHVCNLRFLKIFLSTTNDRPQKHVTIVDHSVTGHMNRMYQCEVVWGLDAKEANPMRR